MTQSDPPRIAGIISRGVAAVIDLVVVGVVIGLLYLGLVLEPAHLQPDELCASNSQRALLDNSRADCVRALPRGGMGAIRLHRWGGDDGSARCRPPVRAGSSGGGNAAGHRMCVVSGRTVVGCRRSAATVHPGLVARHPCGLRAEAVKARHPAVRADSRGAVISCCYFSRSNRSLFMTLTHAATKSSTNFSLASSCA